VISVFWDGTPRLCLRLWGDGIVRFRSPFFPYARNCRSFLSPLQARVYASLFRYRGTFSPLPSAYSEASSRFAALAIRAGFLLRGRLRFPLACLFWGSACFLAVFFWFLSYSQLLKRGVVSIKPLRFSPDTGPGDVSQWR